MIIHQLCRCAIGGICMTEATVESFRTRLDQLEHENRRLKNIGALLLLVLGALAVMGQVPGGRAPEVLEVQRLVLVDSAGKRRADLRLSPARTGPPALVDGPGAR